MNDTQVINGVALFMQLGTAVYALRLNRIFGTDRAGWALFGAFALMLAMHVNQVWDPPSLLGAFDLKPDLVYLISSILLLIGLTHVGVLFRERLRNEHIIRISRDELEIRIHERTKELQRLNTDLEAGMEERTKAEAEVRASQKRYQDLVASLDCVVFEADAESFRFTFVSPQCERLLGYTPEQWINQLTWRDLVHREDAESALVAWQQSVRTRTNSTLEFRATSASGSDVWLRQVTTVVPGQDNVVRVRGVLLDMTERRSMELQLRQAQKLESIGRLAGGVAHDFNNILTVIQGHAAYLLAFADTAEPIQDSLKQIHIATERAAQLTSQLLAFGRRQTMQIQVLDLSELVANVVQMLRRILGEDVVLNCQYASCATLIRADHGMIEQLLMNLAVNARDAMADGGELTIATSLVKIKEDHVADGVRIAAGGYACLTIKDTGSGISPEVLPRIFEPFFTTKEVGKGTGLGLAMAYGIVRQHQGWIKVNSEVGHGSTFEVYLPAAAESTNPGAQTAGHADSSPRPHRILVVEDEAPVRELVCSILKRHQYEVLEAESGAAALAVWKTHSASINLLLTDIVMPGGMNGWQLAEKLKSERPSLKVVCMSGYNPDIFRAGSADQFVAKPFQSSQLAEAVRKALEKQIEPSHP